MRPSFTRLIARSVLTSSITATVIAGASVCGAALAADAPGQDTPVIRFGVTGFDVAGNTLLSAAEIDTALRPYTGEARDFGDVQRAVEALEAAYQARGYQLVTVRLPEQELKGGLVKLTVVQTTIGRINVSGNKVVDEANVRAALPTLQPGRTPDMTALSANLKMANDNPARKITVRLQSAQQEGVVDANVEVSDDKAWKAMLNLDNSGTGPTGKTHVGVVLQHANLWGRDHVGSFQYTTTAEEPDKVSVYGLGYHIPLYALGDSIDLFASYSNIDSGSVTAGLFDLSVSGKGTVYGARYNHTLARRGKLEPRLIYGVDVKAFKNSVLFSGENFGNDVTVHPLSVAWVASLPLAGADANVALTLVHNIPGGSRGASADFARARVNAKAAYNIGRFAGAYSQAVGADWQLRLLLNGQWSADALVPGEQFGAGGGSSVRGLEERALSTDSGAFSNVEIYTPNLCGAGLWQCRLLGFVDAAYGRRNKALPGEIGSARVASTGVGLRWTAGESMNMQLDYGHVVHDSPAIGSTRNKVHVRVGLAY